MTFHINRASRTLLACVALLSSIRIGAAPVPLVTSPQVQSPTRVLFVGNSYFYYGDSVHNHVRRLLIASDPALEESIRFKSATIGGAALAHHNVEHLTRPGQLGIAEPFQLVVLAGGSGEPLSERRRAQFREKAIEFSKVIAERGGKVALYMTHVFVKPHKDVHPDNLRLTEELYVATGNEVGALVIPVGLAFDEAYRRRPDIKLHKEFDGTHPDLIGTYLAACTVYASVYGRSPVGNAYTYYGRIDQDTATFLQQVAWDTVKKFYSRRQN